MTLQEAAARLAAAGIEDPMREARILFNEVPGRFDDAITRRANHEPASYIFGRREFWSLDFEVSPAVLIPRPDSETLIETALKELRHKPPRRILDLGTGSGCLLIALLSEWPGATGVGVDLSAEALAVASRNAERLGVSPRTSFIERDFAQALDERFDLVVANPPYIPDAVVLTLDRDVRDFEPHLALKGGPQGLDPLRRIAGTLSRQLAPKGLALFEIGYDQGISATRALRERGLSVSRIVKDLGGNDRVIVSTLPQ